MILDKCPSCNTELEWTDVDLMCVNPLCPAQLLNRIENFLICLGVEEITSTTLKKLNLTSIEEVYTLDEKYILALDGFQQKKCDTILSQIENSIKEVSPARLIESFGIPQIGFKNSDKIIEYLHLNNNELTSKELIDLFFSIDIDDFLLINGFGESIVNALNTYRNKFFKLYNNLLTFGLTFKEIEKGIFDGLLISMTGSAPDKLKRPVIEHEIIRNGGKCGGITKKTNILLTNNLESKSSKLKKAKSYDIEIMLYEDFFKKYKLFC